MDEMPFLCRQPHYEPPPRGGVTAQTSPPQFGGGITLPVFPFSEIVLGKQRIDSFV